MSKEDRGRRTTEEMQWYSPQADGNLVSRARRGTANRFGKWNL